MLPHTTPLGLSIIVWLVILKILMEWSEEHHPGDDFKYPFSEIGATLLTLAFLLICW